MSDKADGDTDTRFRALKIERDTFAALAFCRADVVLKVNRELHIVFVHGATRSFIGYSREALLGRPLTELVDAADQQIVEDLFELSRRRGRIDGQPVKVVSASGRLIPLALSGYTLDPDSGEFFMALHRMGPAEQAQRRTQPRDKASGLLRPDAFSELAAQRAQEARDAGENVEVTLLEVPGLGDLAGSLSRGTRATLMQQIGETVRENSIGGDTAACVAEGRYSLIHASGLDMAGVESRVAELTRKADPKGEGAKVSSTTVTTEDGSEIQEADFARGLMYMLNQCSHSEATGFSLQSLSRNMGDLVDQAISEVSGFKQAVADVNFRMVLQPIVSVRTGQIHHYEALCRFNEAPPADLPVQQIRLAEETGIIHELDLAMVREVIDWLSRRPVNSPTSKVAVNVSGNSVASASYIEGLHRLLDNNTWTRGQLMFEITESARMSDLRTANKFIQGLRNRGYTVCLDDFGAGAASFQYLSALEVDVVKLDGSAVRNARQADKGRAFLSALTELCRRLGTETIAEMIEDEGALNFVRDCGVDYVQGYLFGQPSSNLKDFTPLPNATVFQRHRRAR